MAEFIFQDFLSRFDSRGRFFCSCGREHSLATRVVLVGDDAFEQGASLLGREHGPGAVVWVLSDENTERAAGARWKSLLSTRKILSRVLPGQPRPVPSAELVDQMAAEVRAASPDLLVSVGSGVISDLVKKVSRDTGVANWCVATAASVDAFTSATSSIHVGGFHNAVPAAVSETVICDLKVIENAPRAMILAGLGDLLAKLIAHLDWNLSQIMTGEYLCPTIADLALKSARSALAAARRLQADPGEAARTLTDAVLTSGFAMQAVGTSRPAASAEHTVAHFWEIADAVPVESLDLHGILVGVASRMILPAYRDFFQSLEKLRPDVEARLRRFDAEKPWNESMEPGLRPYAEKVRSEMARRTFDRLTLSRRLRRFEESRKAILELAFPVLEELTSGIEVLSSLDFPFSPGQLGLSLENCLLPCRNVRLLRARYSCFDFAYELGVEGRLYDRIDGLVREEL